MKSKRREFVNDSQRLVKEIVIDCSVHTSEFPPTVP